MALAEAAVNRMKDAGIKIVEFIAVNTDAQALHNSEADVKIHIDEDYKKGLGAGADPSVGDKAARENVDEVKKALEGADMVLSPSVLVAERVLVQGRWLRSGSRNGHFDGWRRSTTILV